LHMFNPTLRVNPPSGGPTLRSKLRKNHRENEIEASFGEWDPMMI